jgi:hypothetical protein
MNQKQAIEVIKQVLDLSIQKGTFQNAESVSVALEAYRVLAEKIIEENKKAENVNTF